MVAFAAPSRSARIRARFGRLNVNGRRTVFLVRSVRRVGGATWYGVWLPIRPNESRGWVRADGVAIRVIHVPGSEAMTAFALDTARECLCRLAQYFSIPYPYEKLDLVAVPDFEIDVS